MEEVTKEFEYIANTYGFDLRKFEEMYTDVDTILAWKLFEMARLGMSKEVFKEWINRKDLCKFYKNDIDIFMSVVSSIIDENYNLHDFSDFIVNNESERNIHMTKEIVKDRVLKHIKIVDELVGVEWLVCGLKSMDHKRIKRKVADAIERLTKPYSREHSLEITALNVAAKDIFSKDFHGLHFTDKVLKLVDSYKQK